MASCHSLTYVGDELVGDPLDIQMFRSIQWSIKEGVVDDQDPQNQVLSIIEP